MDSMTVAELVAKVNAEVVRTEGADFPDSVAVLEELTGRILNRSGGTERLNGEWLPVASMIVSICGLVVKLIPLLRKKAPDAQKTEVIKALQAQSGDPQIGNETRVKVIVEVAVNAANGVSVTGVRKGEEKDGE